MSSARESGRLLMLRVEEARWSAGLECLLRDTAPGGILLDCALPDSPDAVRDFLRQVSSALPHAPFLAIREEGGPQGPLYKIIPGLPSPRMSAKHGAAAAAHLGELVGEAIGLFGFNTNFAPLLDLVSERNEKSADERAFGSNPRTVAECGEAFVQGLARHNVMACGKHFPGMGSVPSLAAESLPVSGKPMAALWREDLLPYRKFATQLPMILMSSASYKAYDFDRPRPACLSPLVVEGLLRVKLGYKGIVIAYDFESKAVRGSHPIGESVVKAILAGCDMMIVNADAALEVARELQSATDSGKISPEGFRKSLSRIMGAGKTLRQPRARAAKSNFSALARKVEKFARELRREG